MKGQFEDRFDERFGERFGDSLGEKPKFATRMLQNVAASEF